MHCRLLTQYAIIMVQFLAGLRKIKLPPGGVLSSKSYVDVPAGHRKSDYLYTNFLPNFPPISIPFLKEKHPILIKLGAFYNNLPKIHPIYVIWAPSSLMKPPIAIPNFAKKCPKRQAHVGYVYHVNVRTPPPPGTGPALVSGWKPSRPRCCVGIDLAVVLLYPWLGKLAAWCCARPRCCAVRYWFESQMI